MAQSLRSGVSPAAERVPTGKPSRRAGPVSPEVSSRHRRACADCFRSQLRRLGFGRLTRRDPGKAVRTYHEGFQATLKTGTLYFAGNRKFLLCSDRGQPGKGPAQRSPEAFGAGAEASGRITRAKPIPPITALYRHSRSHRLERGTDPASSRDSAQSFGRKRDPTPVESAQVICWSRRVL